MPFDLMIVGAGPAGISTWLHLDKNAPELAARCLVIDKAVFPRDKVCGGGVGAWSSTVLDHLEIELDIPSLFVSNVEFRFGDERYHLERPNFLRVVERAAFDHALVKTAVARGLELRQDEPFVDATRTRDRSIVRTTRNEYEVQALVGADGALSSVRRRMMPHRTAHFAPAMQVVAAVDPERSREFRARKVVLNWTQVREGLQGYVWHVPCVRNGTPSINHGLCDFRVYRDRPRADLKDILGRELESWGIQPKLKSWSSHPICWSSGEDMVSQPGLLLAGDAAGIEPAFGGGIHFALSYGEIAAKAIIDAFRRRDFSFHDYRERLACHYMGRYLHDCSYRALDLYGEEGDPLRVARECFGGEYNGSALMSLLIATSS